MYRLFLPLLCLLLLLTACGRENEISPAAGDDSAVVDTGIANPWTDHDTPEAAENAVGFSLSAPAIIDGYDSPLYRTLNDNLLELLYRSEDGEVRIRKQAVADMEGDDISGDWGDYSEHTAISTPGEDATITLDGNDGAVSRATWIVDGYAYSITADPAVDVSTMAGWTAQIR